MTTFLRLLQDSNKEASLLDQCASLRSGGGLSQSAFETDPDSFAVIPGAPFCYWVSDSLRQMFVDHKSLVDSGCEAWMGLSSGSDFQWLRLSWEVSLTENSGTQWVFLSKGGEYSKHYPKIHLVVDWTGDGDKISEWKLAELDMGRITANNSKCWNRTKYFRPGLTWSRRTNGLSFRLMPRGCIFGDKGPGVFVESDDESQIFALSCILNSSAFGYLVSTQLARVELAQSFEVGLIQQTPIPVVPEIYRERLEDLSREIWTLKLKQDSTLETSNAFLLPELLRGRLDSYDVDSIPEKIQNLESEIDSTVFDLYGFGEADRAAAIANNSQIGRATSSDSDVPPDGNTPSDDQYLDVLSWAVGVAMGRFDVRLATGERENPEEPKPLDPLPEKSPGMLPDGAEPFHPNAGILVDDEGHLHDLPNLLEEVLQRVDAPVQVDTRRWLQREFFPFHLQRYSKSRRKAPIYWPLSTLTGAYTLWLYYPDLTSQTLFTAVNDFIEPKLQQVRGDLDSLRGKGNARSKQEEEQLEVASDLSQELADLRDALLAIAPKYSPNHDDGVQITAAPLWQLFRHKPWQKALNDTWGKLERGDYDWSHLAMNYWPERVLRKCHQDRSLAIAHDVEDTFWREVEVSVMRGKKPTGETKLEWQPKELTDNELDALIQAKIMEKKA